MSKLKKFGIVVLSIPLVVGLIYATRNVVENYKTGDWNEDCGTIFTNPHYRECKQRRVWIPRGNFDFHFGDAQVPKEQANISDDLLHAKFATMWVIVDPFQEYGGVPVGPGPTLPDAITKRLCVPGSFLWHHKNEWVCVKNETRPNGVPDDLIFPPLPPGYSLDK